MKSLYMGKAMIAVEMPTRREDNSELSSARLGDN